MAHDVLAGEVAERDVGGSLQDGAHVRQARDAAGRSVWDTSPVTTIFEPKPSRVKNIFICSGVEFCASSKMMKLSFKVRPRMKASGAISMVPFSMSWLARSASVMS